MIRRHGFAGVVHNVGSLAGVKHKLPFVTFDAVNAKQRGFGATEIDKLALENLTFGVGVRRANGFDQNGQHAMSPTAANCHLWRMENALCR
jgi:hypothetical protein